MHYDEHNQDGPRQNEEICPWCHATIGERSMREHLLQFHRLVPSDADRLNKVLVISDPGPRDWLDHEFQNAARSICPWCWNNLEDKDLVQHIIDFHRLTPADASRVQQALQKKPPTGPKGKRVRK